MPFNPHCVLQVLLVKRAVGERDARERGNLRLIPGLVPWHRGALHWGAKSQGGSQLADQGGMRAGMERWGRDMAEMGQLVRTKQT